MSVEEPTGSAESGGIEPADVAADEAGSRTSPEESGAAGPRSGYRADTVAAEAAAAGLRSPAIIVIGEVVDAVPA